MSPQTNYEQDFEDSLKRLNEIGIALSVERDIKVLLERIVLEARGLTHADAGTLYLVKDDHLTFEITQNDTLKSFSGGTHGEINLPPVPLRKESVAGYAAVTGEILNIEDVYADQIYHFEGPKIYDRQTGYRTKSVLVVPMKDHEDQVMGVVQLLNATNPATGKEVAFTADDEMLIQSLASQAAVAISNVRLIEDTEQLFHSFVQVMATAIDEKSSYTGGHIRRVMEMTMVVAEAINACSEGPLAEVHFTDDQLNEIRIAAWMHDIGKITTPEAVVDKPTKLSTIFDRIELLRMRYTMIKKTLEADMLQRKVEFLESGQTLPDHLVTEYQQQQEALDSEFAFLEKANTPGEFMDDDDLQRVQEISKKTYVLEGEELPFLSADEVYNLSIRKGSLTEEERLKINEHAAVSIRMLKQIPFTNKLKNVPAIAGAHHEKLDGSGYPLGLKGDEISLQARMLALVDIFESLSDADRPYKKPMPRNIVLRILQEMVDDNHIDRVIHDLFLKDELYLKLDDIKLRLAWPTARKP
jgi:HD-GYP domain-containing protein (c-di-GMP phosphodiesterase class II)